MRLTPAEWQLMRALWDRHPATAREIAEGLPEGTQWAYTTIKTMLSRLVAKGALSETKRANTSVYEPLLGRGRARMLALTSVAEQAFDGAFGSLMHFLVEREKLSDDERRRLIELLDTEETEGDAS